MDADIQFGDVEETRPGTMRRPDENHHFAVVACGDVREDELPIYVELDAMLDMEEHALSNTGVELGGVLLGGQYVDGEGRPFVVVHDCLRANHYESTKGSFKFTHDTWGDITRRHEQFPEEVKMVGWYHTHPDWGVFLSGMDLFICENFFNKPLDLALVIDPCRGDRGWFRWVPRKRDPLRNGGFYLIASRFRQNELEHFAHMLGGKVDMAALRSTQPASGGYGAPVVNVTSDRNPWPQVAIIGILAVQTLLIAALAFGGMNFRGDEEKFAERERVLKAQIAGREEALDDMLQTLAESPDGFVNKINGKLSEAKANEKTLASTGDMQRREIAVLSKQLEEKTNLADKLKDDKDTLKDQLKLADSKIESLGKELADSGKTTSFQINTTWILTGLTIAFVGAVLSIFLFRRRDAEPDFENPYPGITTPEDSGPRIHDASKEPPEETNKTS